jgi:hypothetical protein
MSGGMNEFDEEIYGLLGQTVSFQADIEQQMKTIQEDSDKNEEEEEEEEAVDKERGKGFEGLSRDG